MIDALERCVEEKYPEVVCYSGDRVMLIRQPDITRVYSENRKIVVCTDKERYECKQTLSDLEEKLDPDTFVRISRFELINLKKVAGFDLNIAGTIKVYFKDRSETFVARRYVSLIQQKLKARIEGAKEK